ncbi:hypothetical protein JCM3775_001776 [Rhodotorula graminis]
MASTSSAQASVGFLSAADDLLTKLLLDYSIFNEPRLDGRATGKMMRFARELRMSDKEVASARELVDKLRQGVVSVPDGLDTLLNLPCVKTFNQKWDDEPLFAHHAKRYIIALRPDSGIAFHETDRYKNPRGLSKSRPMPPPVAAKLRRDPSTFIEVGVFATRAFKKGEVVNLRGGIADLTEEEDDEMRDEGGRSDFSVLWSQRKECFCLLLGPARFVNHDCRNNVEFQLTGTNMAFKVLEDVAKDEELFTHYGEHYFEHDNASCLCATCEQLKQGAFAPARPRAVAAVKPRASSPTPASRRSRRASTIAAPDYNEARPSTSTSAAAAAAAPRAGRAAGLSRSASTPTLSARAPARPRPRSSRMNPTRGELSPADALRGQPRLIVQPKLAPPPGYARDYDWDPKKRVARYKGPKTSSVGENAASTKVDAKRKPDSATASTSTSAAAPAKRGRPRSSTTAAHDTSPAPSASGSPRKAKKPRASQVVLKQVRVGERSSKRQAAVGKEPVTARARAESTKLRQVTALGRADEAADSSDLSEAEEGDEDEAMDEAAAVEAQEEDEVEAMLSPARRARGGSSSSKTGPTSPLPFTMPASSRHRAESSTSVTLSAAPTRSSRSLTTETSASAAPSATVALRSIACDVGMSTSTPVEESHSPQLRGASLEDDLDDDKDALSRRKAKADRDGDRDDDAPHEPISAPTSNFYGAVDVGASVPSDSGGGSAGAGTGAGAGASGQQADFRSGPSQEGGPRSTSRPTAGSSSGGSGGGGGGGGGGDDGDGRQPSGGRAPVDMMDEEEEEEKPKTGEEDDEQEQGKGGAVAPSGEVQAASDGAPEEEGRPRVPPSDPEDAAAALLMLLCAPPQPQTPSSTAPTPPHAAESTNPSGTTSASTSASGEASSSRSNVRRGRTSNESRPSPGPSLNPRSTRRHSKLPEPSDQSTAEAGSSTAPSASASGAGKKKARISAAEPAASASERRRSTTRSGAAAAASTASQPGPPPSLEARRTRSQPLPGKLADVLYAPETLAATGGYDYEKGRYISKFEAARDPSHNPLPPRRPSPTPDPTPSPSPPPPPPARKPAPVAVAKPARRPSLATPPAPSTPRVAPSASTSRPPSAATGSSGRAPAPATSTAPPDGVRSTRRSFPIAGPLRDLIYSPAAVAANGGWDAAAGKYVSAASASMAAPPASTARRASSASVQGGAAASSSRRKRPGSPVGHMSSSSAPPADVRSTRRSFPMANTRMADLVYSPAARLVSGGWDPALGRYVSASKGETSTPRRG